jgi:hypothetical protein
VPRTPAHWLTWTEPRKRVAYVIEQDEAGQSSRAMPVSIGPVPTDYARGPLSRRKPPNEPCGPRPIRPTAWNHQDSDKGLDAALRVRTSSRAPRPSGF